MGERKLWMDRLRGIAVLLVVAMHAVTLPSLLGMEILPAAEWASLVLAPYRIPALLVLSGMLLPQSLRKSWGRYYWGKFAHIVWPFIVWSAIYLAVDPEADGGSVWFWLGGSYLWYLVVITFCYLIGPLTRWIPPLIIAAVPIIVMLAVTPSTNAYIRILENAPYFFVGVALVPAINRIMRAPGWIVALSGTFAAAWGMYYATYLQGPIRLHLIGGPISIVGILCVAWLLARPRSMRWAEWSGRHSLELYVAHFPVMLLVWKGVAHMLPVPAAYMVLIIAGIAVPAILATFLSRSVLFRFPATSRLLTRQSTK